ncbi:transporter substrate-binding domain-containing protein [Mitsuaria sp. GD03876]|uniref:substrate-binding periplasmic protein n=1 Tax=Mitsuaria sp. GD03876 TaxID=2975399 RepID=UPI00244870D8|nr:transporter substrate-binding domain-containing protein [Mitsuaria sp. GD03876]MDH0863023.1 transporter substrate-binding domain-containing protein [Mitsuaria sp. GD03876]
MPASYTGAMPHVIEPSPERRRCCLLLAAALLPGAMPAAAWASRRPADGPGELVGFTENLPPLNYADNGVPRGFATELLQAMAAEAGQRLRVEVLPWQRSVQESARQADSVLFSLTRTPEREAQFRWIGPISPRRILVYRLSHRTEVRPASLKQLNGWRLGVSRDSASAKQLLAEGLRPETDLELGLDDATNLRKLLAGRMDLIVLLDWAAAWHLREMKLPYEALTPVLPLDVDKSYWFGMPADGDPALARRLQAALDRIRRDGRYERLRQQYFA